MKLTGNYIIDAKQEAVWNVLMDPQAIANALPGVDELVPIEGEEDAWDAVAKIGFAAISGTYTGSIRLSEVNPIESYRLTAKGKGQQSIIDGTVLITLAYNDESSQTEIEWDADAKISGKLARVGQRVFNAAATSMSGTFFDNLAAQIPNEVEAVTAGETVAADNVQTATSDYKPPSFLSQMFTIIRRFFSALTSSSQAQK